MNLIKCSQGHFYDGDKFPTCPHCSQETPDNTIGGGWDATSKNGGNAVVIGGDLGVTEPVEDEVTHDVTTPLTGTATVGDGATVTLDKSDGDENEGVTIAMDPLFDSNPVNTTPAWHQHEEGVQAHRGAVVGWLVCVDGKHRGRDFRLYSGKNPVGRSEKNIVVLSGEETVSRENQVTVIYDPKSNNYLAVTGSANTLSYLNGDIILQPVVLKKNDMLEVGSCKLMFIPCCDANFTWQQVAKN